MALTPTQPFDIPQYPTTSGIIPQPVVDAAKKSLLQKMLPFALVGVVAYFIFKKKEEE